IDFWASPRSLVATEGISVDFFSSGYLDISVPRVRPAWLCIHHAVLLAEWVSPFRHCRIKACCQLPDTFRRLPRPSSPLTAKASTVCAYSLDHITPSRLRVTVARISQQQLQYRRPSAARLSLYDTSGHSSQTLATSHLSKNAPRLQRQAASDLCVRRNIQRVGGSGRTRTTGLTLIR